LRTNAGGHSTGGATRVTILSSSITGIVNENQPQTQYLELRVVFGATPVHRSVRMARSRDLVIRIADLLAHKWRGTFDRWRKGCYYLVRSKYGTANENLPQIRYIELGFVFGATPVDRSVRMARSRDLVIRIEDLLAHKCRGTFDRWRHGCYYIVRSK